MISIGGLRPRADDDAASVRYRRRLVLRARLAGLDLPDPPEPVSERVSEDERQRSEEHTSELQSLMSISYDVCCLHIHKQHSSTEDKTTLIRDTQVTQTTS